MLKNKKTESPAVEAAEEKKEPAKTSLVLTEEQKKRHGVFMQMIEDARIQYSQPYQYFDDMTYADDYHANAKAAMAYLRPKINDDEIRVVTGTTEKKLEVLSNEILAMNLQAEAVAYDDADNELKNLGSDMMDIVKRTNDMEKDDDFWQAWLRECLSQRAVFFEEVDEYKIYNSRKPFRIGATNPDYKKVSKSKQVIFHKARKRLIPGLCVYLGDMFVPARDFQTDQPYIILYRQRSYTATKQIYGDWNRWVHVRPGKCTDNNAPEYYRMNDVSENMVEEIRVIDPVNNEYYVVLNGVPMMEKSTPLWYEVLPDRRYTISMITIKEVDSEFAYGKPPVASSKTLQSLNDEIIRNLVYKFRQALEPAMGVRPDNAHLFSRDIFAPSAITQGLEPDDIFPIDPNNKGVTQSEFNLYDLIEKKTEEFIGAGSLQQGVAEGGEQTATEIQTLQTNAIKNLGHIMAAYMRAKRDAPYLRVYNLLENFTSPIKNTINPLTQEIQPLYQRFTISDAVFSNNKRGKKIVQFSDRNMTPFEKQAIFEFEQEEERRGRPTRFRTINIKALSRINVFWHIVVTQQRREGSALNRILFKDEIEQAVALSQITGRQINENKVIDEFEYRWQVKDFFKEMSAQPNQPREGQEELRKQVGALESGGGRSLMGSQLTEGQRGQGQRPSLSETMKQ